MSKTRSKEIPTKHNAAGREKIVGKTAPLFPSPLPSVLLLLLTVQLPRSNKEMKMRVCPARCSKIEKRQNVSLSILLRALPGRPLLASFSLLLRFSFAVSC